MYLNFGDDAISKGRGDDGDRIEHTKEPAFAIAS